MQRHTYIQAKTHGYRNKKPAQATGVCTKTHLHTELCMSYPHYTHTTYPGNIHKRGSQVSMTHMHDSKPADRLTTGMCFKPRTKEVSLR